MPNPSNWYECTACKAVTLGGNCPTCPERPKKFKAIRNDKRYLCETFNSIVKSMDDLDSFVEQDLWSLRERLVTLSGAVIRLASSVGESLVEVRNG